MRERTPCVYVLASRERGTLYIGVTSDLPQRVWLHRTGQVEGFTRQYTVTRLVWFEVHEEMLSAIAREKRLKASRRAWKIELVESNNPGWVDLYPGISA